MCRREARALGEVRQSAEARTVGDAATVVFDHERRRAHR